MRPRVLVVEDEIEIREMTRDYLQGSGLTVVEAHDVSEALKSLEKEPIELIVSDISLGADRQGRIRILEKVREKELPVVLISGFADFKALIEALNLGARFFIEKPFDLEFLTRIVRELLHPKNILEAKIAKMSEEKQLTARESELFQLLSKGLSNRDMAATIGSS